MHSDTTPQAGDIAQVRHADDVGRGKTIETGLNRGLVSRRRQERGGQVPVWGTHSRFIVSYQTLRRSEHFEPLKTLLEEKGRHKSMRVLDEAHAVAPASASRYAVDTETTRGIRSLADHFEHRLSLPAIPHNGHSNIFSALVDRAVLDAHGWSAVQVPPYCGATAAQLEAFEDDVLDRLFDLNERRAHEEARLGAATAPAKKSRAKKTA